MKRAIVYLSMAAVAALFGIQLVMEHLFVERRIAQTMAQSQETEMPDGVSASSEQKAPEIIAVFGIDGELGEGGRSDCIMLAALDEQGCIRLCSIARDSLISIPETGEKTKLCHAYAYGGPKLAVKTLEENYGLHIDGYVTVDFEGLSEITDELGGVTVSLTRGEWKALGLPEPYLGQRKLSGAEALAYCRLRALDNDSFRMERQRKVMEGLLSAFLSGREEAMPAAAIECFSHCRSDLSLPTALRLVSGAIRNRNQLHISAMSVPGDVVLAEEGVLEDGVWYYTYDLETAGEKIREFFGEDTKGAVAKMQQPQ
ncbi:MAG: LCP family protein [Oscillospiraceae bacterium]|nr:LCP family protein [Oscillospiraceae bacterium]